MSGMKARPAMASGARNGIARRPQATTRRRRSSAKTRSASGSVEGTVTNEARRLVASRVERRLPGGQARPVGVDRRQVRGDVDARRALDVDQPQVAFERRIQLIGTEHLEHGHLAARAGQLGDGALGVGVEAVADQDAAGRAA